MEGILDWVIGAAVVVGLMQWIKGFWNNIPKWLLVVSVPLFAIGYSIAPTWGKQAAGIVALSQLGYETLFQPFLIFIKRLSGKE